MSIALTPVSYRVDQSYNHYLYYVKRYNMSGQFKWFAFCGTEVNPEFFSNYKEFKYGFDSPEEAADQI